MIYRLIPLHRLLFAVHDMDWIHVDRWLNETYLPPVDVELLPDGWYFVHDGRHRATAAYEKNYREVEARIITV